MQQTDARPSEVVSYPAPAKLNLMLRITGRRSDGYHKLQTVFQFIDRQDQLQFRLRDDGEITLSSDLSQIPQQENLCYRAARKLQSMNTTPFGADIHLQKKLPMGGGLGGGSSDAATTLVALNHLWGLDYTSAELKKIGLSLGADVPIFIHGRAAWAEGVCARFGYAVRFQPIGEVDAALGAPTQMGVFTR